MFLVDNRHTNTINIYFVFNNLFFALFSAAIFYGRLLNVFQPPMAMTVDSRLAFFFYSLILFCAKHVNINIPSKRSERRSLKRQKLHTCIYSNSNDNSFVF